MVHKISWIWNDPHVIQNILQNFYMDKIFALARINRCFHKQAKNVHTHSDFTLQIIFEDKNFPLWVTQGVNYDCTFPLFRALSGYENVLKLKLKKIDFLIPYGEENISTFTKLFLQNLTKKEKLFLLQNSFPHLTTIDSKNGYAIFECEELIFCLKQIKFYSGVLKIKFNLNHYLPKLKMIIGYCLDDFPNQFYLPNLKILAIPDYHVPSLTPKFSSIEVLILDMGLRDDRVDHFEFEIAQLNSVKLIWIDTPDFQKLEKIDYFLHRCHVLIQNCPNLQYFIYDPTVQTHFAPFYELNSLHQYPQIKFIHDKKLMNFGEVFDNPQKAWDTVKEIYPQLE